MRAKQHFREVDDRSIPGGEEMLSVSHKTGVTPDDASAEIDPVPVSGGGHAADPEIARLSQILEEFNMRFGGRLHADPENARVSWTVRWRR